MIWSTNPLERVHKERKRRTDVVAFPEPCRTPTPGRLRPRCAATSFKVYVATSDSTKAAMLAAASSQAGYAAEFNRQGTYWDNNPAMVNRDQAGFESNCNYR